jgi:hypothetical protein
LKLTGKITAALLLFIMMFTLGGLVACAGNQVNHGVDAGFDEPALDKWLEDTLIPYLVQQLGEHPRFKGQPIVLVRMHNDNVQPRIDALTDHIREKIVDALLREPGLDLYWRPATRPLKHHQSLADISCGDYRKINYYIGIDCRLTDLEQKLSVKVRALNLAEHKWVSGFGRSWQGRATAEQLTAIKREHPDAYLRGLRPLPFSSRQPDLLAVYLARNLSCLLRQGDVDDLVVYVEDTPVDTPDFLQTTLKLVGKYLGRFREVAVTDDPNQANVALITALHSIDKNMYQIWVSARDRRAKKYLPGAETEAYVLIESQKQQQATNAHPERPPEAVPNLKPARHFPSLISTFNLITPADQRVCATDTPWRAGARRLASNDHLTTGSCLAVEMRLSSPAHIFLVGQDATGDLTRMFPSGCPDFRSIDGFIPPEQLFHFPPIVDPGDSVLELEGIPGMERLYAIAVTTRGLADQFEDQLSELQGLCQPGSSFPEKLSTGGSGQSHEQINRWRRYLKHLAARYPEKVQWREFRFWHDRSL